MTSGKVLVAAGFVIFRRIEAEIQYLLLQTSYGEHHWTPPKGHVDPGESEFETALRETQEEAGLTKDNLNILKDFEKVLNYEVKGKPKKVVYWLSELKNPTQPVILSHEHIKYEWLKLSDAVTYAKYSDLQQVLKDAEQYLCKSSGDQIKL